jgi:hypothetical protein
MQARAAFHVGSESAAQFSREYSRVFGRPPLRDIKALRFVCLTVIRRRQGPRVGARSHTTQFDCQFTAFPAEVGGALARISITFDLRQYSGRLLELKEFAELLSD